MTHEFETASQIRAEEQAFFEEDCIAYQDATEARGGPQYIQTNFASWDEIPF